MTIGTTWNSSSSRAAGATRSSMNRCCSPNMGRRDADKPVSPSVHLSCHNSCVVGTCIRPSDKRLWAWHPMLVNPDLCGKRKTSLGTSRDVRCGCAVEKVSSGRRTNFFSAAGASRERRREGPHRSPQKRSLTFVLFLQRLAAAETMKTDLREIFRMSQFSTFSTISVTNVHWPASELSLLCPRERTFHSCHSAKKQ